jgi:4-hydroxybenzoate polyprenyltransferase
MFEQSQLGSKSEIDLQVMVEYLVYSSVYLSFAAGAMVFISSILHQVTFSLIVSALGMLITYSIYNLNRKTDESEDAINHAHRYAFTKKNEKILYLSGIGAYLLAFVLSGFYGISVILVSSIPLFTGLIYSMPILPKGFRCRRLKEIPVVKSLLVAIAWALPPALLPVYVSGASPDLVTLAVILFFFSLVFINTVLFDIRDLEGDRAAGVSTIPVLLGIPRTKTLLTLVNVIFGIAVLSILLLSHISPVYICLIVIGMIYAQAYILLYQNVSTGNLRCDIIADGQFIVLGLLMIGVIAVIETIAILQL